MDYAKFSANAAQIRLDVFTQMRKTRGTKYDTTIRGMQLFPYVMLLQEKGNLKRARLRGELLSSYYVLMRSIDDIVDTDAPLPPESKSTIEYVTNRIKYASGNSAPSDPKDHLLAYCNYLARELGFRMEAETIAILRSMRFDAVRVEAAKQTGKGKIFSRNELEYHFHQLDIEGTVRGMLKLFDEDPEKTPLLMAAGNADRIKLTLKDLTADLRVGLINIPAEDMAGYRIMPSEITEASGLTSNLELLLSSGQLPPGISRWVKAEANKGLELLGKQKQIMEMNTFRTLGRIALRLFYTGLTEKYFNKLLEAYAAKA